MQLCFHHNLELVFEQNRYSKESEQKNQVFITEVEQRIKIKLNGQRYCYMDKDKDNEER